MQHSLLAAAMVHRSNRRYVLTRATHEHL